MTGESHLNIPKQTFIKASFVLFGKSHGICHGLAKNIVHELSSLYIVTIINLLPFGSKPALLFVCSVIMELDLKTSIFCQLAHC